MQLTTTFVDDIANIWKSARTRAYTLVNKAMIDAHWQIGYRIVQEEQNGKTKADYGTYLLKELASTLTKQLDKQLDERELRKMRQFYLCFPDPTRLRPELTWSHFRLLLRVEDQHARAFYQDEAASQGWSTRQLERNIQSLYYMRILTTKSRQTPVVPALPPAGLSAKDLLKDPYVLEFLSLEMPASFSESDLEGAILSKLQWFLLEMGQGFAFVGRQYQVKTDTKQFFIDLVFYNYILKCFVLAEIKLGALTHRDIGQMDMYVRLFEDLKKIPGDNPTIGIILCSEKDETLVKYSVLEGSEQLFASRYRMVLPSEEELSGQIEESKELFSRQAS